MKLMTQRLDAAFKFTQASRSSTPHRVPVFGTPDADLSAAPLTVALSDTADQFATDFCGAWGIEVFGARGKATRFQGKKRISQAVAHVQKRMAKDTRLNVQLMRPVSLDTVGPLLDELAKLGTLQLQISVEGADYQLPMTDAPAWAGERIRALQRMDPAERAWIEKLQTAMRDSITTCQELPRAIEEANKDAGNIAANMARAIPIATEKCACNGVDVDALELFVGLATTAGRKATSDGFLELRIDPQSQTVVHASSEKELVDQLAKLPREQRTKGIKLELVSGANAVPAHSRERCRAVQ